MTNKTDYAAALRKLADWLDENDLPDGVMIGTEGGHYVSTMNVHGNKETAKVVREALGGKWKSKRSGTTVWRDRLVALLGFAEVTVFG